MNSKIKLIEDALFCTSSLALSYSDPDQKWIIRQHLISLLQDHPSFKPRIGFFLHNDGTEVKLLNVRGGLRISQHVPDVPLIIWLHEFYPQVAPIVHVDSTGSMYPLHENNPFVHSSSGATMSSYLANWEFRKCNLLDLVRSLIKLFTFHHPFYYYSGSSSYNHPSMVHRMEAMDRLACMIHDESDKVSSWLRVYENGPVLCSPDKIDDAFEALDEKSEILLELEASDNAIEDVLFALDEAVSLDGVDFRVYLNEVRALAREQFSHRFRRVKVEHKFSVKRFRN